MEGYIKLWRALLKKPIWLKSTPEQKVVLVTLLLMANYYENEWEWKGIPFKVEKGEFVTSLESIRKSAGKGISIQNIRAAIIRFKKLQFLTEKSTKSGRLITIINWDSYQPSINDPNKEPNKDPTKTQHLSKKYKKYKKEKNKEYSAIFLSFWKEYPVKKGKGEAYKSWRKQKPNHEIVLLAIKKQTEEKEKLRANKQFCPEWPHPATWINQARWEDEEYQLTEEGDGLARFLQRHQNAG